MRGRTPVDPEQERGERVLREMRKLERRKPETRRWAWFPFLVAALLLLLIALVLVTNFRVFETAWTRLARPDSLPGLSP